MNNTMRNLTLSAAALAALTVIAPKAAADDRGRDHGRGNAPRQESRGNAPRQEYRREAPRQEFHGRVSGGYGSRGRAYVAPVRPVARYAYGYRAPFRIFSGFRFYSACPGPNYVYISDYGWVVPPFFGAVWIPGHYDIGGYWVDGFWR
jgi:hypothetical protein